jgi:hypothetical protein
MSPLLVVVCRHSNEILAFLKAIRKSKVNRPYTEGIDML